MQPDQTNICDGYGDLDVSGVQKSKEEEEASALLFETTDP